MMTNEEAIAMLKTIISIPSHSGEEDRVADLMEETWKKKGYHPHRKGNNVWVKSHSFKSEKPTILLDAHIDTVKPSSAWTRDPYIPTECEGKLFGLGSNDTGGSVVAMMAAFTALDRKMQDYNLIYLSSAEEENTGKQGIQSVIPELGTIALALVGEPTGMQAAIAEKGLMVLDCVAKGKAGHAARDEGINAIYQALADIEWFRTYRFAKVSELLGEVKMTVTGIQAGCLHNVVPAECGFMVDIRINEHYTNQEVYDKIREQVNSEIYPRSFSLNSSGIAQDHPIVCRCRELGINTFGSPTTSDQAVLPFTSLKIGPGDSARSHTADEYIGLEEIEKGIALFIRLLDGFRF